MTVVIIDYHCKLCCCCLNYRFYHCLQDRHSETRSTFSQNNWIIEVIRVLISGGGGGGGVSGLLIGHRGDRGYQSY
jgi:hypothetical protein